MPFLKFEAQDASGRIVNGTLQAENQQELDQILAKQGLRRVQAQPKVAAPVRNQTRVTPATAVAARPVRAMQSAPAAVAAAATPVIKSFRIRHSKLFFMFSQMASFARSGFGPVEGIQRTTRQLHERYVPMLQKMVADLSSGKSLSDAMALFPRTFSCDIVHTVKAGEVSGQLPDALELVAKHEEKHAKFLVPIFYFLFMFPLILFMGISIFGIIRASGATMLRQDQNNSNLPPVKTLLEEFVKNAPSYYLWATIAVIAFVLGLKILHSQPLTRFRHLAPFAIPGFKSRSRNEGIARFAWCLDAMLRAGAAPATAIYTAIQSIPNIVIREEALRNLGHIRENESLSSIMDRSKIVSYEYVDIIANGEMTGTLPNALNLIRETELRLEDQKTNTHKLMLHLGASIFMGIVVFCFVLALYRAHYTNLFSVFDRE